MLDREEEFRKLAEKYPNKSIDFIRDKWDKIMERMVSLSSGTYQFHGGHPTEGLTGYAIVNDFVPGDFGDDPLHVWYVYYREAPFRQFVAYVYPKRVGYPQETTGVFTPYQGELDLGD